MSDFTFLDKEHLQNDLNVFKKIGRSAQITDFAIVLGGYVQEFEQSGNNVYYSSTTSGHYWTKVDDCDGDVFVIDGDGKTSHDWVERRNIGARPILPFLSNITARRCGRCNVIIGKFAFGTAPTSRALGANRRLGCKASSTRRIGAASGSVSRKRFARTSI